MRSTKNDVTRLLSQRDYEKVAAIIKCVQDHLGLQDLNQPDRRPDMAWARQMAMVLCREFTNLGIVDIALAFERHHGCVVNAAHAVERKQRELAQLNVLRKAVGQMLRK